MGLARGSSGGGRWARLSGCYFYDDRVAEAGPAAELLYVRGLAYCAQTISDGFISEQQVRRLVAVGLDDVEDLCKALVGVGLWDRDEDRRGYVVRQWLKWNRSGEEIERYRSRDAARKRSARKSVDVRSDSERTPSGVRPPEQSRAGSSAALPRELPDTTDLRRQIEEATRAAKARTRRRGEST